LNRKLERYMNAVSTIQSLECLELTTENGAINFVDEEGEEDDEDVMNNLIDQFDGVHTLGRRANNQEQRVTVNPTKRKPAIFDSLRNLPNLTELILNIKHIDNDGGSLQRCKRLNRLSLLIAGGGYPDGFSFNYIFNIPSLTTLIIDFEDNPVSFLLSDRFSHQLNSNITNLTIACMTLGPEFLEIKRLHKLKYLTVIIPDGEFSDEDEQIYVEAIKSFGDQLITYIRDI
jgi:hypothetical protein